MNNLFSLVFQIVLLLLSLLENLLCQVKRRTSKKMNNKKAKTSRFAQRKLISNGTETFQNGLPKGNYLLQVEYSKSQHFLFCF